MKLQKPILKKGDTAGLITPSGFINQQKLDLAVKNLESFGLNVFYYDTVLEKEGFLAGNDRSRLNELHKMYNNPNVDAIVCVRGGYGITRLLEKINFDLIRENPKPLIGYSDITALINSIYKKTHIPGFHGIVGSSDFTEYTSNNFRNLFFETYEQIKINIFPEHKKSAYVITGGTMKGQLAGGNLAMIVSALGTPFDVSWENKIVFLEDIAEAPYKIDRMLTHLISAGKFKNVKGIILGQFFGCEVEDSEKENSFSLKEVIKDRIKPLKIPAVYGFSFGHISNQAIFPTGVNAEFDTEIFSLSIKREEITEFFI